MVYIWNKLKMNWFLNLYHLMANAADNKLIMFFLVLQENTRRLCHFIVWSVKPNFQEKIRKIFQIAVF